MVSSPHTRIATGGGSAAGLPLSADQVVAVLQPIVDVWSGAVVAAEALARFPGLPDVPPGDVLARAHRAGVGARVEAACLEAALRRRAAMPSDVLLCVNLSPDALGEDAVRDTLSGDLSGIVLELTEQAASDQSATVSAVSDLRRRGALLAIDDASTGYAGLLRLARLRPDIVKLDRGLVAGARDRVEQSAVIEALVSLSRRIGAQVLGEGVETVDDLAHLAALDVDFAQGWVIAPPAAAVPEVSDVAVEACRTARRQLLSMESTFAPLASATAIGSITAMLAGTTRREDLFVALRAVALRLGIDTVSLSTLSERRTLRELTSTNDSIDGHEYALTDFPATAHALQSGAMVEAHVHDARTDPAERGLLERSGFASMLLTPILQETQPAGVLEFLHRSTRRWTTRDIGYARILSAHLAHALERLSPG